MSAIWGEIYYKEQVNSNDVSLGKDSMKKYKIDRLESMVEENVLLGCGHQYVTKEAEFEELPYRLDNLYYTADVMLDNREELIRELHLSNEETDGKILLESFLKWKGQLGDHVLGVFSAVFYEKKEDTIWIFTDHTGSRCINYLIDEKGVYFSTTIEPLPKMRKQPVELSEKWMAACTSNCTADLYLYDELTPFEGVKQLEAGHYLRIKQGKVEKVQYWKPADLPKLKVSDEEALKLFRETFSKCVTDVLRSSGETGITLSSGLDSTSVACVAARKLKTHNRKLHSYTSIPLKEYKYDKNAYEVPNEEQGVRQLSKYYDNIEMNFLDCVGKNPISDLEELIPILECPYKSGVNLVWLNEIYKKARAEGCRLILKGQFGNGTISYGSILTTVYQLCARGHFVKAYREIKAFGKKRRIGRRKILKVVLRSYKETVFQKIPYPETSLVKEELKEKHKIYDQILWLDKVEGGGDMDSEKRRKGFLFSFRVLEHLGGFDTRLGLANGIIIRDPTKDKRIIELCMRLPITAFASEGIERRLVRKGMRGIVPNEILDVYSHRGQQGADFVVRMQESWSQIASLVKKYLNNTRLEEYLSMDKVKQISRKVSSGITDDMDMECMEVLTICSISHFLEIY